MAEPSNLNHFLTVDTYICAYVEQRAQIEIGFVRFVSQYFILMVQMHNLLVMAIFVTNRDHGKQK